MLSLPVRSAYRVIELLDVLAGLPSTPEPIAQGAREVASTLAERLPSRGHRQPYDPAGTSIAEAVEVGPEEAAALLEILQLFEEIPSTPEDFTRDVRELERLFATADEGRTTS